MTNHLWQSTIFALLAGLATLAFRKNRAQVRYWLWFSASFKFFIPLALLMSLGSHFEWAPAANSIATPAVSMAIEEVAEPFPETVEFTRPAEGARDWKPAAIFVAWACGFWAIGLIRLRGWLRVRAAVRASIPLEIPASVEVRASPGLLEPGVVGWLHPILLVPEGIAERLTARQLEAVLAHELCHVRRRDNLTSAIHMIVEALFWFHPLVWWIGARLVEERERACDEGVLSLGSEPHVYAEAILNVCKLYVESPLACVSGVTGSDLKKRIEAIMTNRLSLRLNFAKKVALAAAGIAVVAAPIVVGMINLPRLRAQVPVQVTAPVVAVPVVSEAPVQPPAASQVVAQQKTPPEPDDSPRPVDPKTYVIGPADVLSIDVFNEPDLTRVETVGADGKIKMPLVGDMQAAGLTVVRFGAQLKEALSVFLVKVDVTITVLQVNSKHNAPNIAQNAALPVFEVASIKLCDGGDSGGGRNGRGGGGAGAQGPSPDRLSMNCQPLRNLIRTAYVMFADGHRTLVGKMPPIEGGPSWVDSDRYQVTAKAEGTPGQDVMRGPMLQALLEDRFKLKIRRETREVPVYNLTVAKNGPKLQPSPEGSCTAFEAFDFTKPPTGQGPICAGRMLGPLKPILTWRVRGGSLDDLARSLGADLDRIVINKTGIPGKFDFRLEFSPDETTVGLNSLRTPDGPLVSPSSPSDPAGGPSIFTAIQEQLGLKLESAKGPREFLVVDRAEKPSEN